MKKIYLASASILIVLSGLFWKLGLLKKEQKSAEPYSGISEILNARAEKAQATLLSVSGTLLTSKDWPSFHSHFEALDAAATLIEMNDLIRAMYIQKIYTSLSPSDYDEILLAAIKAVLKSTEEELRKNGAFLTQFFRLPAPQQNSKAHSLALSGVQDLKKSKTARETIVLKMIRQDANPNGKFSGLYQAFLTEKLTKHTKPDSSTWIRSVSEIRSPKLKADQYTWLHEKFNSLSDDLKGEALQTFSLYPNIETDKLKKLISGSLSSKHSKIVEGGLSCLSSLSREGLTTKVELEKWAQEFSRIPTPLRSGYVDRKIDEILQTMTKM